MGRIILKMVLKKQSVKVWNGLKCFITGSDILISGQTSQEKFSRNDLFPML
jgi:hypothetical protein